MNLELYENTEVFKLKLSEEAESFDVDFEKAEVFALTLSKEAEEFDVDFVNELRRGATVTHVFEFEGSIEDPIAVQLTYRQSNYFAMQKQKEDLAYEIIEPYVEFPDYKITRVTVTLSQLETLLFTTEDDVLVQLRVVSSDGKAYGSNTKKILVQECLDNNLLPLGMYEITGVDTSDATLESGAQLLLGVTAYAKGIKYTGTIPNYNGHITFLA